MNTACLASLLLALVCCTWLSGAEKVVPCSGHADCAHMRNMVCSDGVADSLTQRRCMCALASSPEPSGLGCRFRAISAQILVPSDDEPIYIAEQLAVNRDTDITTDDGQRVTLPSGVWLCWADVNYCQLDFWTGFLAVPYLNITITNPASGVKSVFAADISWRCSTDSGYMAVALPSNTTTDASVVFGGQSFDRYCVRNDSITVKSGPFDFTQQTDFTLRHTWPPSRYTATLAPQKAVAAYTNLGVGAAPTVGNVMWCAPGFIPSAVYTERTGTDQTIVCAQQNAPVSLSGVTVVGPSGRPFSTKAIARVSADSAEFVLLETSSAFAYGMVASITRSTVTLSATPMWMCKEPTSTFVVRDESLDWVNDFTLHCLGCGAHCGAHADCGKSRDALSTWSTPECSCASGFSGSKCDRCTDGLIGPDCSYATSTAAVAKCRSEFCSGNGDCTDRGTCFCDDGWFNDDCSETAAAGCGISDAAAAAGMKCVVSSREGGKTRAACSSSPPRFGTECEMTAEECALAVCGGRGVCVLPSQSSVITECVCTPPYTGGRCDQQLDCKNGGVPLSATACNCTSADGWTGADCGTPTCAPGTRRADTGGCDCSRTATALDPITGRCSVSLCGDLGVLTKDKSACRCKAGAVYHPNATPRCMAKANL